MQRQSVAWHSLVGIMQQASQRVDAQQSDAVDRIIRIAVGLLDKVQEGTGCATRLLASILALGVLASLRATPAGTMSSERGKVRGASKALARAPTQHGVLCRSTCTWQAGMHAAAQ